MTNKYDSAMNCYAGMEELYKTTKPIRGRAEDVRPIGDRRRTWERIVRGVEKAGADGEVVYWYGAHLYNTVVVKYFANGEIELACDGWATPSTADFMHMHTPRGIAVSKQQKNLWIRNSEKRRHLVPQEGALRLRETDGVWQSVTPITLKQIVVDRTKMKEARESIKEFRDFAKTMMRLSDGWVMAETIRPYIKKNQEKWWWTGYDYGFDGFEKSVLREGTLPNYIKQATVKKIKADLKACKDWADGVNRVVAKMRGNDIDTWQRMMYQMCETLSTEDRRLVMTTKVQINDDISVDRKEYDEQYKVEALLRRIDNVLKCLDVYTTRIVDDSKVRSNVVM